MATSALSGVLWRERLKGDVKKGGAEEKGAGAVF